MANSKLQMALCSAWHSCTVSGNDFGFFDFQQFVV